MVGEKNRISKLVLMDRFHGKKKETAFFKQSPFRGFLLKPINVTTTGFVNIFLAWVAFVADIASTTGPCF